MLFAREGRCSGHMVLMVSLGKFQGRTKLDCDEAYDSYQAMSSCGSLLRDS